MATIDRLLQHVRQAGGSDLHLADGQPPWMRRNGQLAALAGEQPLGAEALGALLKEIVPPGSWEGFERGGEATFAYSPDGQTRFRVSCFRQAAGRGAACRLVPAAPPGLAELGLAPAVREFGKLRTGLVLIAGPTGAGVSTTVAALLQEIALNQSRRILTVEDPIEYVLPSRKSTVAQREIGTHVPDLATALRDAARNGFDVISVGELRGRDSIALAMTAVQAGALVIGTLRSSTVVRALDQITGVFPEEEKHWARAMLANVLRGVCVQHLVPKADGSGRCAVNEVLVGTPGVGAAIREGYISKLNTMIQSGGADGMITLDDALRKKVEAKVITAQEALARANDKSRFQGMVKGGEAPGSPPPPPPPMAGRTQFITRPSGSQPTGRR